MITLRNRRDLGGGGGWHCATACWSHLMRNRASRVYTILNYLLLLLLASSPPSPPPISLGTMSCTFTILIILSKLILLLLLLEKGHSARHSAAGDEGLPLGLVCAGDMRQRVVLASPVPAGNKLLLLLAGPAALPWSPIVHAVPPNWGWLDGGSTPLG